VDAVKAIGLTMQAKGSRLANRQTEVAAPGISHNLNGQRLGRKGRDTRDRIIAATQTLLDGPRDLPITLSAVAREASLGMTSLYSYFNDLTELLLAMLEPAMAEAEGSYVFKLRSEWPEATLKGHCLDFVHAFYGFWLRHSRLLHLRNSLADNQDGRMARQRVAAATIVIRLIVKQMDQDENAIRSDAFGMATVLYAGIERIITVATDDALESLLRDNFSSNIQHYLESEARLLELGIRDYRGTADQGVK
jgi:AcrR family transcriptional regulator